MVTDGAVLCVCVQRGAGVLSELARAKDEVARLTQSVKQLKSELSSATADRVRVCLWWLSEHLTAC